MIAVTEERSPERVMQAIVDGLNQRIGYALTRLWVKRPGDRCETCRFLSECDDHSSCLHLVASSGHSKVDPEIVWDSVEGGFSRFPLGVKKIGRIGATGQPILIEDMQRDNKWVADKQWAKEEDIRSFAGQPLIFRGEILGVLGIFCRKGIDSETFGWLRFFADQAAVALANARAFEEIEALKSELEDENALLREEVLSLDRDREIIGNGTAIQNLLQQIELVSPTDAAILINGESGSGKELVARAIHRQSRRAEKPLIKVNCAAIPRELFESEFFGHVKGAFTGAVRDRVGRFQLADRGTLFLDEVGEIPLDLQSKLLRVLQEGEFERIGETSTRKVDVRIIAATNRNLKTEVDAGNFREDLYYRLSVFPVNVPTLRERKEDIPSLLSHFIQNSSERLGVPSPAVSHHQLNQLKNYDWPGNVRELNHVVERATILARGGKADFSFIFKNQHAENDRDNFTRTTLNEESDESSSIRKDRSLRDQQIKNIENALQEAGGRIYGEGGAAELLGIPPSTLTSRIKRWKIKKTAK